MHGLDIGCFTASVRKCLVSASIAAIGASDGTSRLTANQFMVQARAVALSRESGHHAFVVASNSASVTAIDISDPAGPSWDGGRGAVPL